MVQPAGGQEEALQEARETHVHGGGTQGQGGTTGNHGNMVCEYVSVIWENGKSLEGIVCMGKIAASVLLNLFINDNKRCHTTDAPSV